MTQRRCLVIGASGAIGSAVVDTFSADGYEVWGSGRTPRRDVDNFLVLTGEQVADTKTVSNCPKFDAVVWAQGVNRSDSILDFDDQEYASVMNANVGFVARTLSTLLRAGRVEERARFCVVSSIWQEVMRPNKLSYSVSKAALGALIKSSAIDLAPNGYLINGVLPGVLETPMTRSMLDTDQMSRVEKATGFNRLVTPVEIATATLFLCSVSNTAITGQSLVIDLGFSNVRAI